MVIYLTQLTTGGNSFNVLSRGHFPGILSVSSDSKSFWHLRKFPNYVDSVPPKNLLKTPIQSERNYDKAVQSGFAYGEAFFFPSSKGGRYYVDKTSFLRLIEEGSVFQMLIRPRRMGKSFLLGVIDCYFGLVRKDTFETLFQETDNMFLFTLLSN